MDNQPKTDSAPPSPQGEKPNWHPPDPAPEGQSWKCPDCYSWVTLGENAWYHALRTGHGKPALESIPAPAPPAPHDTLREGKAYFVGEEAFLKCAAEGGHDGVCLPNGCGECFWEGFLAYRGALAA
ncbi:hypothetical protein LCGC14_1560650, partial [marine sediment metagenome]